MEHIQIKVVNKSNNPIPEYSTEHSAGMDIRSFNNETIVLRPMERKLIPTGLFIEIPVGYEAQIRPRSGLALKYGITVLNSPGTIDSDYRGEVGIILINLSDQVFEIKNGDRIAQMIISEYSKVKLVNVTVLSESTRGAGGFGHSGI